VLLPEDGAGLDELPEPFELPELDDESPDEDVEEPAAGLAAPTVLLEDERLSVR
jgi:hypothetical protein